MPARLRAAILLGSVLDVPLLRGLIRALTPEPVVEATVADGLPLEIVRPAGSGPWPAWVFVNGAHPERRREPVVRRLTEGLARAGYVVIVPDPPGLADEEITGATLDGAVAAVRAAAELPVVRGGRVALLGVSTGASLALLTAADPEVRDRISVVAAAVPYADLERIICLATTSRYEDADGVAAYPVGELLSRVVRRSLAAVAVPGSDDALAELLGNADFERFPELYARLPDEVRATVARLSPLAVATQVAAPVELVVPPRDEYFPQAEATALARALPTVRLTVTGTLDHTRPAAKLRSLGSLPPFWRFAVRGLRLALR